MVEKFGNKDVKNCNFSERMELRKRSDVMTYFTWDPNPNIFILPLLNHPLTWYGLFFGTGFLLGYFFLKTIFISFCRKQDIKDPTSMGTYLSDQLILFVAIGTLIGARLGHVFLYGWSFYKLHPEKIIRVWEGGLASHGGVIGILCGVLIFWWVRRKQIPGLSVLMILDALVIPAGLTCGCIRLGNFMNQEILGMPTTLPWGVIFLHPIEGLFPVEIPLHPVQLYEAISYFAIFAILYFWWKKRGKIGEGFYTALFFVILFGVRFFIEFLKQPEGDLLQTDSFLNMGQWLSIPFFIFGIALLMKKSFQRTDPNRT